MSSTGKTAHLELNQWAATDPVLREDFNADNLKLENAFSALPYETLADITTTQDAAQVDVDLSGIDMTKYIYITAYITAFGNDIASGLFRIRLNNESGSVYHCNTTSSSYSDKDNIQVHYIVPQLPCIARLSVAKAASSLIFIEEPFSDPDGNDYTICRGRLTANSLQSINLVHVQAAGRLLAGTHIKVVGVRK